MSTKPPFGKMEFTLGSATATAGARRDPEAPFRMAVLGDFSGRASRSVVESISGRRAWPVDCDNFEEVFSRLNATLRLPAPWTPAEFIELRFASVDDFHPDRIFAQVKPLGALLQKRKELLHPSTAAAAAAELQILLGLHSGPAPDSAAPAGSAAPAPESNDDTFARLLGGSPPARPASPAPAPSTGPDISQLIRNIIAPSVVPSASPEQTAVLSALDLELTHQLRAILHHPAWQALEAAWRGADLLVRQFGGEENLKISLIDLSHEELTADLQAADELSGSGTCKLLREQSSDTPWALLIGSYLFRPITNDLETLGRVGKISALLGAPFLAGAAPGFVGCDSFGAHADPDDWTKPMTGAVLETWQALRELPEASSVGLALPRFLARQPYGKQSDPITAFPFEELPAGAAHETFLWGNPAVLCGFVLADAFQAEGWEMQAAGSGEVGDLPVYKFKDDGETKVKPCAEAWLSEHAGEAIQSRGFMPLLSIKGRDAVRLAYLQSISRASSPLNGRWG